MPHSSLLGSDAQVIKADRCISYSSSVATPQTETAGLDIGRAKSDQIFCECRGWEDRTSAFFDVRNSRAHGFRLRRSESNRRFAEPHANGDRLCSSSALALNTFAAMSPRSKAAGLPTTSAVSRPHAKEFSRIQADAAAFFASMEDREVKGPPITLPDGSAARRLPGFRRWLWDGEFGGSIGLWVA